MSLTHLVAHMFVLMQKVWKEPTHTLQTTLPQFLQYVAWVWAIFKRIKYNIILYIHKSSPQRSWAWLNQACKKCVAKIYINKYVEICNINYLWNLPKVFISLTNSYNNIEIRRVWHSISSSLCGYVRVYSFWYFLNGPTSIGNK